MSEPFYIGEVSVYPKGNGLFEIAIMEDGYRKSMLISPIDEDIREWGEEELLFIIRDNWEEMENA